MDTPNKITVITIIVSAIIQIALSYFQFRSHKNELKLNMQKELAVVRRNDKNKALEINKQIFFEFIEITSGLLVQTDLNPNRLDRVVPQEEIVKFDISIHKLFTFVTDDEDRMALAMFRDNITHNLGYGRPGGITVENMSKTTYESIVAEKNYSIVPNEMYNDLIICISLIQKYLDSKDN